RERAEQQPEQRGFAGSVRPEHGVERAGGYGQADVVQGAALRAGIPEAQVLRGERGRLAHAGLRVRSTMKIGTPTSAVMTPTGISTGAAIVRAAVSVTSRNTAPPSMDAGRRRRWSLPQRRRTAWGTINPMKPITPQAATVAATRSDATTNA